MPRVEAVFTPGQQARENFVDRPAIEDQLVDALDTPGRQAVVYGHSGSGKSSLIARKLSQTYPNHITTRCQEFTTFEAILLDAFDQLEPWYSAEQITTVKHDRSMNLAASYARIRASVTAAMGSQEQLHLRRVVPPQLTSQRLAQFLGAQELCWVLEDFHKVSPEHKVHIAQSLKVFTDEGSTFDRLHVILVGATATAREVVEYDPEMRNRISEIYVPLMSDQELTEILVQGSKLLNVEIPEGLTSAVVQMSVGLGAVCHELALNMCRSADVRETQVTRVRIARSDFDRAVERYVSDSTDTIKSAFDRALRRHRVRKYDNCRLILKALASGAEGGLTHREILDRVQRMSPGYPASNLTNYLNELITPRRGSMLRLDADSGRFSFRFPIYHAYAKATLLKGETGELFGPVLDEGLRKQLLDLFMKVAEQVDGAVAQAEAASKDEKDPLEA